MLEICAENDASARAEENALLVTWLEKIGDGDVRLEIGPDRAHGTVIHQIGRPDDSATRRMREFNKGGNS